MAAFDDVGNPSDDKTGNRQLQSASTIPQKFFVELPYSAALFESETSSWCGCCFRRPRPPSPLDDCENHCGRIRYCSRDCVSDDRLLHQFECQSYLEQKRPHKDPLVNLVVRLVGRLVTRYSKDKGVMILPKGVPSKDLTFNTLINRSNGQDMDQQLVATIKTAFRQFFEGTLLFDTPEEKLGKLIVCAMVNSIEVVNCKRPHDIVYLGNAIYIVTSQFGQSCNPTATIGFDGNRIEINTVSNDLDIRPMTLAKFNAITVCYLSCSELECNCYAVASDPFEYKSHGRPIGCKCDRCIDDNEVKRQLDSSVVECQICKEPLIWKRVDSQTEPNWILEPSCHCEAARPPSITGYVKKNLPKMIELVQKFGPVVVDGFRALRSIWNADNLRDRVKACVDLIDVAMVVWSPKRNIRLGRLYEVTFRLYDAIRGRQKISGADLNTMIEYGEMAISIYQEYFNPHVLTIATLSVKVARALAKRNIREDIQRARQLYRTAENIFTTHQDDSLADAVRMEVMKLLTLTGLCNLL